MTFIPPLKTCNLCKRLCEFRKNNQNKFPSYYNGPVEPFGDINAQLLIVGLAPGLHGANQTGRPFTNDYAGDILYPILKEEGFAKGEYKKVRDDGFDLINARVTNSVRCVPPENKPINEEENNCRNFLKKEIEAMPNLKVILCLGTISHKNVLKSLDIKQSSAKFQHGVIHDCAHNNLKIVDSYHTSRYNINTGVLTYDMFKKVINNIKEIL